MISKRYSGPGKGGGAAGPIYFCGYVGSAQGSGGGGGGKEESS
jgi:hypothetical protein